MITPSYSVTALALESATEAIVKVAFCHGVAVERV